MKKNIVYYSGLLLLMALLYPVVVAQTMSEIEKQKQAADKEIKETRAELGANEKKVTEGLASLRKIDDDILVSQREVDNMQGQLLKINGKISGLETDISKEEGDLSGLRGEYLKAVKKMRVARKRGSGLTFLFASGSFNEARRRVRYMQEFSEWKDRRSGEIINKVNLLNGQREELVQARRDADVALKREQTAREKLEKQKEVQQTTVAELKANSESLKSKLARRQAEARKLSNQISALIAEQKEKEAREAEARKRVAEEKRLAEERRLAEEKKAAAEKQKAEEAALAEAAKRQNQKATQTSTAKTSETASTASAKKSESTSKEQYAESRKRRARSSTSSTAGATSSASTSTQKKEEPAQSAPVAKTGFESMKGQLPKPVAGSFKIVSAFGVHPISPELPDIMDENLGIDAHVANGANACAVFDGEVIKIYDRSTTPGFRNIIVVKHGDFITVYANLETLSVRAGQHVKQGQSLGTVGSDFDDPAHGMIHFELWKNQTHLDPAAWIRI